MVPLTMHLSVASGFSRLSQEIIDEIIDYYFVFGDRANPKKHREAIKACPLISRAFRDRAQKHLFTKIYLDMYDECQASRNAFKRLNDVFSANPRLASHVRALGLQVKERNDLWKPCFEDRNFWGCIAHIWRHSLGRLPSRFKIILTAKNGRSYDSIASPIQSHAFETHLVPFLASRLTKLVIASLVDVPVALFDTSHNLVKLHIDDVTLSPFDDSKRVPIEKRPLIRDLWVRASQSVVCSGCCRFDELVKVTFLDYDVLTVRSVLTNPPPSSLKYLVFDSEDDSLNGDVIEYGSRYSETGAELSMLPSLLEVTLYITFPRDIDESCMDVVSSLAHFLRIRRPAEHQITELNLAFEMQSVLRNRDEGPQMVERLLKSGNWAALDSLLVSMATSVTHKFNAHLDIFHWINFEFHPTVDFNEIVEENLGYLSDWGPKYLPRISSCDTPNLELGISCQNSIDHYPHGYTG